ncbi:DUF2484 family protein [Pseudooceanicola sp.]|uniref:DUF2484 family protein n=1 Tax=Pseudooceanicola sp. TaxID=1914328 RepID=UPI0026127FF1|nr:DUF2484 family protein [Pseudooceanicola sp.]MDF1854383.1 DUF2484 family protein [Pseudooceanicola sp.]
MSLALLLGCFWVLAAAMVALLPMRMQYIPGVALLAAAPLLIGVIWWDHGWFWGGFALFGFLSMFRNPLRYLWARLNGGPKWRPDDKG